MPELGNPKSEPARNLKADAIAIWTAGIKAVDAQRLVRDNVAVSKDELRLGTEMFPIPEIDRLIVVGFGKASGSMAAGFEEALGERLFDTFDVSGLVLVPDDQVVACHAIEVMPARPPGENLPTQRVLEGTGKVLELVRSANRFDIVVCLISGGGSALLEKPIDGLTLEQLRTTTSFLSSSGASIYELNAVRQVISQVKGGGLALASGGAAIVSLIVSDVVGDQVEIIASGPTAEPIGDVSPLEVLEKFDADRQQVPDAVWAAVEANSKSKPVKFEYGLEISNCVIGGIETATSAAAAKAQELGYVVDVASPDGNEGDAEIVGRLAAKRISCPKAARNGPVCMIVGGETTVRLCATPGQGGRNQHLVLAAIDELVALGKPIESNHRYCLLSAGSDGEDGNVSVAGAVFDSELVSELMNAKNGDPCNSPNQYLKTCNSHAFLARHGLLINVPPTRTNVGDLRIALDCDET